MTKPADEPSKKPFSSKLLQMKFMQRRISQQAATQRASQVTQLLRSERAHTTTEAKFLSEVKKHLTAAPPA